MFFIIDFEQVNVCWDNFQDGTAIQWQYDNNNLRSRENTLIYVIYNRNSFLARFFDNFHKLCEIGVLSWIMFSKVMATWLWVEHMGQSIQEGPTKIFGRQPLKNLKWYGPLRQRAVFHKFYLVDSWIPCPYVVKDYIMVKVFLLSFSYGNC